VAGPKHRFWKLPPEIRREIIRLAAKGLTFDQIRVELDCAIGTVSRVLRPMGGVYREHMWGAFTTRLSLPDRVEIRLGLERGWSFRRIALGLGRATSTVSREVGARGGRQGYQPFAAHELAWRAARRPKPFRLADPSPLLARVTRDLERLWSPQQIRHRLRLEFPDSPEMWVSHETIYQSLFVQGRGELRRELAACLRTGRTKRISHGRAPRGGSIPNKVMISERPAEVDDRAVPGHWEGDLIIGKDGKSAVGTLVERTTRFVMLLHLPDGRSAEEVRDAMTAKIATLPDAIARSITWDQGVEMAEHATFTVETGIPVYFCDPHSPWQRGTNENTNGLIRQYMPKGTDLLVYDQAALDAIADSLNGRPRDRLDWKTPAETLNELLVALTA
jgi:transposase, IS30 family